ncbi:hypothetical protein P7C71_g2091, partial [Lecanoromycetidae sp. Uapishka_2]
MSVPRLTFLYPHMFKSARVWENALRTGPKYTQKAGISTAKSHRQETYAQRYGTAAEPRPPTEGSSMPSKSQDEKSLTSAIETEVKGPTKPEEKKQIEPPHSEEPEKKASDASDKPDRSRDDGIDASLRDPAERATELDASESHPQQISDEVARNRAKATEAKPLETILEMGPPTTEGSEEHKAPHLHAPPYVHHFDTFTLVKSLGNGGFTEDQSVSIMKAIRGLLAENLDVAKDGLVSKSDVENVNDSISSTSPHLPIKQLTKKPQETYLFRAACSELRTEILNTRKSSSTKTRTQLSHLQHTYDILSQRTTQETQALKDDLRGMLNDRRMAVRDQQQSRDSEISELHYKISVALNSDAKSVVEGLRWFLTRRAAFGIATMALLILGSLRYSSYKLHEREIEARKKSVSSSSTTTTSTNGGGGGASFTVPSRE